MLRGASPVKAGPCGSEVSRLKSSLARRSLPNAPPFRLPEAPLRGQAGNRSLREEGEEASGFYAASWLGDLDSNQDQRSQSPSFYH